MVAEILAVVFAAMFTGASLYAGVVEHPARMSCTVPVALAEWRPSFKRAMVIQPVLILLAGATALIAFFSDRGVSTLVAAIVLAFVYPWTLVVMMPTNRQLLDETRTAETPETDVLLKKWGRLHNVRTVAGFLALAILVGNMLGYL